MPNVKRVNLNGTKNSVTDAWRECEPFDCNGTLKGDYYAYAPLAGRLDDYETSMLKQWADMAHIAPGARFFVVKSYETPIAWAIVYPGNVGTERYKVSQKFSVTTSRHQGRLH